MVGVEWVAHPEAEASAFTVHPATIYGINPQIKIPHSVSLSIQVLRSPIIAILQWHLPGYYLLSYYKIIGFKARTSLWNAPTDFWYLFRETALFQGCYSWHLSHHSLRDIGLCPRAVTLLVTNTSNKCANSWIRTNTSWKHTSQSFGEISFRSLPKVCNGCSIQLSYIY